MFYFPLSLTFLPMVESKSTDVVDALRRLVDEGISPLSAFPPSQSLHDTFAAQWEAVEEGSRIRESFRNTANYALLLSLTLIFTDYLHSANPGRLKCKYFRYPA